MQLAALKPEKHALARQTKISDKNYLILGQKLPKHFYSRTKISDNFYPKTKFSILGLRIFILG